MNENLGSFFQSVLRQDRSIGSNFNNQLFVVSLLFNAIVFSKILYVDDRSINRIDCNHVDGIVWIHIFIGRHITTTLVDGELDLEAYAWV